MSEIKPQYIFKKIDEWSTYNQIFKSETINSDQYLNFINSNSGNEIGKLGALSLLKYSDKNISSFKKILLNEALENKFLNEKGSVKYWQQYVSERLYFFIRLKEKYKNIFSAEEEDIILNWFKAINNYAFKVTTADYAYAYLFKQPPIGFYYNQEIGFGMLALLYHLFKDIDNDLANKNYEIIKKYAVGWSNNFRNTDDGISYHQNIWIINSYLLYKYAGIGDLSNAKFSFDWIVKQSPIQNGVHPNYNSGLVFPALNSLLIGLHLTNSEEYKFITENMLEFCIKNNLIINNFIGMDLMNFTIKSTQPPIESFLIYGATGTNSNPKQIEPDKIVLRQIIAHNELFVLINLRSSGWHRYNGSGSITLVKYGNEILLSDNISTQVHNWLPKGKADHRDKKITNSELNIYQPESNGTEKLFYYLFSFDETLKFRNYDNFIDNILIDNNKIEIKLDKKNILYIVVENNILDIRYNENSKIFNYKLTERSQSPTL